MKSIRVKLVVWICVLFLIIGASIYFPLSIILPKKITSQIIKRDAEIAKYLSISAKDLLLLNDKIALSILLHDNLERLKDAQYLFVQGPKGKIIAHTFMDGFPKRLISLNPDSCDSYCVMGFMNKGKNFYDIAVPILGGELGNLHLGVSLESGQKDINEIAKIKYYVALVILIGLGIGIGVFLIIGLLFSNQIIKLRNFTEKVGEGDLESNIDIKSEDEIGDLAKAFNEMVRHLREKIEEIKKLHIIEERNRIAFNLHDGCAQEMASIIKRLELCKKLFKIDEKRAFEELDDLKKNAKGILNETRHVILDLKRSKNSDLNFSDELTEYIEDYKKQNKVNVTVDVSDTANELITEKSKIILHIIREALTNVRKHSSANNVELKIEANNGDLEINIRDDGKGFDIDHARTKVTANDRLGLLSIQERALSLNGIANIYSKPQKGTHIHVRIPLETMEPEGS